MLFASGVDICGSSPITQGSEVEELSFPIYGEGDYPNNTSCSWIIQVPANHVIEL